MNLAPIFTDRILDVMKEIDQFLIDNPPESFINQHDWTLRAMKSLINDMAAVCTLSL